MFLKVYKSLFKKGLDSTEILILAQIMEFEANKVDCFISNETLAENFGVSVDTIKRRLTRLENDGYIIRDTKNVRKGKERHIKLNPTKSNLLLEEKEPEFTKSNLLFPQSANCSLSKEQTAPIKDNIEKIKIKDKSSAPELTASAVNPSQNSPDVKEVGLEQAKQMWGNTFTIDEGGYIVFSADSINVNLNRKFKMRQ